MHDFKSCILLFKSKTIGEFLTFLCKNAIINIRCIILTLITINWGDAYEKRIFEKNTNNDNYNFGMYEYC